MFNKQVRLTIMLTLLAATIAAVYPFNTAGARISDSFNKDELAKTCTSHPRFTSWYNKKPTLYIWGIPNDGNDSTGIGIYYYDELGGWIQVSVSSEWGIQMVPQVRESQWTGYYIATRWSLLHPKWDDDWRWYVEICS